MISLFWARKLVATLGDSHTSVIDSRYQGFPTPYTAELKENGELLFLEVPSYSAGTQAGVSAGWKIYVDSPHLWLETAGSSRALSKIAARNFLSLTADEKILTAHSPDTAEKITWREKRELPRGKDYLEIHKESSHTTYLKFSAFYTGMGIFEKLVELCKSSTSDDTLVIDLRGNTGGNLMLAKDMRELFLRQKTLLGYTSFTDGCGHLSELVPCWGFPSSHVSWQGSLIVLIDELTYSAAEDFVLGLQGLSYVKILGKTSGGGSGRPRSLPLGPQLTLRISTAITYDRNKRPIEHYGIQPDDSIPESLYSTTDSTNTFS